MRNPLLASQPLNTSKTRRETGEVELGAPTEVFPYRGTEAHGVEPTARPKPVPGHEESRDVPLEPVEEEPQPIPVVVRNEPGRQRRYTRFTREYAPITAARQTVGREDARLSVKVKNLGAEPVWIGNTPETANAMHGWPLAENETFESTTQGTLYAMSSHATDQMQLAVAIEYVADLSNSDGG